MVTEERHIKQTIMIIIVIVMVTSAKERIYGALHCCDRCT